jgi:hypothetical protein
VVGLPRDDGGRATYSETLNESRPWWMVDLARSDGAGTLDVPVRAVSVHAPSPHTVLDPCHTQQPRPCVGIFSLCEPPDQPSPPSPESRTVLQVWLRMGLGDEESYPQVWIRDLGTNPLCVRRVQVDSWVLRPTRCCMSPRCG